MRWIAVVLVLAGCGRLNFDDRAPDATDDPLAPLGIAAGTDFTCSIRPDHSLWCWGNGRFGQLGDNHTEVQKHPVASMATDVAAVVAGLSHVCALDRAGVVSCWGRNEYHQVSPSTDDQSGVPVAVALPGPAISLNAGGDHSCAITSDHALYCWGKNDFGQTGQPLSTTDVASPVHVLDDVIEVAAGDNWTCAIRGDHALWCWGGDDYSQLGDGRTTTQPTPRAVGISAAHVTCGDKHTCILTDSGAYNCWGYNNDGELGNGTETSTGTPGAPSPQTGFTSLTAGNDHTCGITADRDVACWGLDAEGEIGDGGLNRNVDGPVVSGAAGNRSWIAVATGSQHTCALREDGSVACWGNGSEGQLGDGTLAEWLPKKVMLPGPASDISAGTGHTCALVAQQIYCWGENWSGQIGTGASSPRLSATPQLVSGFAGNAAKVSAGLNQTCGVTNAGVLRCWGANGAGQLGDGTTTGHQVPQPTVLANVNAVSAGDSFTCAASSGGTGVVSCWGTDNYGQLGDNGGAEQSNPVVVPNTGGTTLLGTGTNHACSIGATNHCWGRNVRGQLGAGMESATEPPTTFPGAFVGLAVGGDHTCARTTTVVRCWGKNSSGQLGVGNYSDRSSPTMVTLSGAPSDLAAGGFHTCAIDPSGLSCWGSNDSGQLGDGTGHETNVPRAITGVPSAAIVAGGYLHTCAIDAAGGVWCWGDNTYGQLGIGTFSRVTTPVDVAFP